MSAALVTESASNAFANTRRLLFDRVVLGRWLKLGLIAMIGARLAGGGGGLRVSVPNWPSGGAEEEGYPEEISGEAVRWLMEGATFVAEHAAELLLLLLGLGLLWLVCAILFLYIRCVFRLIFVDVVAARREPSVRASWRRHHLQGWSLLGWLIVMGMAPLVLIIIALLPMIASGALMASGQPVSAVLGAGGLLALIALLTTALTLLTVVQNLTEDFLVPAMYVDGGGIVAGWRRVFAAWRGHFWTVVVFYLLKLAFVIGAAIVAGLAMIPMLALALFPLGSAGGLVAAALALGLSKRALVILLALPLLLGGLGAVLALSYLMHCLLLPLTVFFQSYSLSFIGRLDASLRTI